MINVFNNAIFDNHEAVGLGCGSESGSKTGIDDLRILIWQKSEKGLVINFCSLGLCICWFSVPKPPHSLTNSICSLLSQITLCYAAAYLFGYKR